MAGIYVHIPFCKQACYYCDFHFSTNQDLRTEIVKAIVQELVIQKSYLGNEAIETIYFGGGTPSLLTPEELALIFKTIKEHFAVIQHPEITLEANPDDLSAEKLQILFEAGVNRLSIGIQTFHDSLLTFLHRAHDSTMATTCVERAREVGFKNISIDLIYGIPQQTDEMWRQDIALALALNPEHLSCYSLTIEEKTVFGRWQASGKLKPTPDDTAARHFEILMDTLEAAGYEHYEISNFSKPRFHSRHNSSYWKQTVYLGVGPSAHSYNKVSRQYNISNNSLYLKAMQAGTIPFDKEELSNANKINEYILTTLRTHWGTSLQHLRADYGYDMLGQQQHYLNVLVEKGYIKIESDTLLLTRKGKLLADKISSELFVTL
jgi:oxygen-independent coproporphyrinogen-3 oxidase